MEAVSVVGIGADGWAGLTGPARATIEAADVVLGSARQLALIPDGLSATTVEWPMPLLPSLVATLQARPGRRVVLASGDPTFFGIATTIARLLPDLPLDVVPHPSSVSLACARMAWAQQDVAVVSLVGRSVSLLIPHVHPGRRIMVLAEGAHSPADVARLLRERGFGPSLITALSNLEAGNLGAGSLGAGDPGAGSVGAGSEQRVDVAADDWPDDGWPAAARPEPLTVLAVECVAGPAAVRLPLTPGLPDEGYEHDGQLTKRHVRAITLAALAPSPGELLWDVGGGAGSIGIEWMRAHPSCRAVAVERDDLRAKRIGRNAVLLGVPGLKILLGEAPAVLDSLAGSQAPDAVFIGGGVTVPGLLGHCWDALRPGGRMVVNVATLESEQVILEARSLLGGDLVRIEISRETPVGRYTAWRPAVPVTQWTVIKESPAIKEFRSTQDPPS